MNRYILLITFILLIASNAFPQETIQYYSGDFGLSQDSARARYKSVIQTKSTNRTRISTYMKEGDEWIKIRKENGRFKNDTLLVIRRRAEKIWANTIYRSFFRENDGQYRFTDRAKGTIVLEGNASNIFPLHKEDTITSYYRKNRIRSIGIYENNRLISSQNWLQNGNKYYDDIHYFVDRVPEYSKGQTTFSAYIMHGIQESGIDITQVSDRVEIGWVVMEDGGLEGFHAISGAFKQLNNLLITLIKDMPGEWTPASINGEPVRYYMKIPFNFVSRTEHFESLDLSSGVGGVFMVWD